MFKRLTDYLWRVIGALVAATAWVTLFWAIWTFWVAIVFLIGAITTAVALWTVGRVLLRGV